VLNRFLIFVIVFCGGGIGSMLRHAFNQASAAVLGTKFPFGTLGVNLIGSMAIGALTEWFALRGAGNHHTRLFLITGVLGGFTTFSAFSLDTALLWQRGDTGMAITYVGSSVGGAIVGIFSGMAIAKALLL